MRTPDDGIEQYRAAVTRYLRYLVRDASDADDLTQEAFLRAHQQRGALRDVAAMESWLYQIATHAAIDRMRQRVRSSRREIAEPVEDLPLTDQKQTSPLAIVQQAEMSACVQRYVAKLSDMYKAVLLLHDADGLTGNEIARLLQVPLSTVKMRLHRARRKLQAALNEGCDFERDGRGVFVCEPKPDR
ncbi:MAG TPA: RNA polymerase sigma factor [Clostridia bacterium]|nr:RNA polymerase sigma factor [Clostridia bacterium]